MQFGKIRYNYLLIHSTISMIGFDEKFHHATVTLGDVNVIEKKLVMYSLPQWPGYEQEKNQWEIPKDRRVSNPV